MLRKIILFSVLFVGSLVKAEQQPYLISGFDDVLRQAENTGLIKATIKIFEEDKGFSGMPELYQVISKQETSPKFVLVSAISNLFEPRIDKFLTKSNFPSNHRYLRNWLKEWSIESFKINKIREILNEKPDSKFIVIFDNSDASINLADKIRQHFAGSIVAVYLRQVQNKKLPEGANGFYTAFDVAANEYENGRLSSEDVYKVGHAILDEKDINSLIPAYAKCPSIDNLCRTRLPDIKNICLKVSEHIQILCRH